jgi:hypothetical protein
VGTTVGGRIALLLLVAVVVALLVFGLVALEVPVWLIILCASAVGGTLAAMVLGRVNHKDCD